MTTPTVESLTSFFTNLLNESNNYYEKELKKEELLKLKLGLDIDKVVIKPSKVHGNGLFAKVHIKKGDIITLYPCDILAYFPEANRDKPGHIVAYMFSDELKDNQEIKDTFNTNKKYYKDYQLAVNESYSIMGIPEIYNNPAYLGHFCNDGARGHTPEDKKIYETISVLKSNAFFKNICDCMMAIVAIRDINIGEEILVTYGHGYWITRDF